MIDVPEVKAVIFDVDGTLYDQKGLRRRMLFSLLSHYAMKPWRFRDLLILSRFRSERERNAGAAGDIENAQYRWCSESTGVPEHKVRQVVNRWMHQYPNRFLKGLLYPGLRELIDALRRDGIKVAIYSDHPASEKLHAMGIQVDLVVSSTDPEVDRLKPDPKGLLVVMRHLGLRAEQCLFIGDRQEMDGECAERAGMPYMITERAPAKGYRFYLDLHERYEQLKKAKTHGSSLDAA